MSGLETARRAHRDALMPQRVRNQEEKGSRQLPQDRILLDALGQLCPSMAGISMSEITMCKRSRRGLSPPGPYPCCDTGCPGLATVDGRRHLESGRSRDMTIILRMVPESSATST
jgi:hypothetical protein